MLTCPLAQPETRASFAGSESIVTVFDPELDDGSKSWIRCNDDSRIEHFSKICHDVNWEHQREGVLKKQSEATYLNRYDCSDKL